MIKEGELRFIGVVEDAGELSKVKIFPEFCAGLQHLNKFSHIIILTGFICETRKTNVAPSELFRKDTLARHRSACSLLGAPVDQTPLDSASQNS